LCYEDLSSNLSTVFSYALPITAPIIPPVINGNLADDAYITFKIWLASVHAGDAQTALMSLPQQGFHIFFYLSRGPINNRKIAAVPFESRIREIEHLRPFS
jgi:hypothetical protein